MRLKLSNVEQADLDAITAFACDAITDPKRRDPGGEWIAALWPRMNTPQGRANARTRFEEALHALPPGCFLKATDTDANGKPVGMFIWTMYTQCSDALPPLELGDMWASEEEKAYGQHIWCVK